MDDKIAAPELSSSGFTYRGRIHLVRSGLVDAEATANTLFHELLHYGIRRFVPEAQYISEMKKLYRADPWIQALTEAWLNTVEGLEFAKRNDESLAAARGVDEALAQLAEKLHKERTSPGVKVGSKLGNVVRSVMKWIADLAKKFGFGTIKTKLDDLVESDASREYVESIFKRLREGDNPPFMMTSKWAYSDPAFMTAWHGSPHDHDKFDSSKIGTGEGAQAYGHGLYFAGARSVAEYYRKNLSKDTLSESGVESVVKDPKYVGEDKMAGRMLSAMQNNNYLNNEDLKSIGVEPEDFGFEDAGDEISVKSLRKYGFGSFDSKTVSVDGLDNTLYAFTDGSAILDNGEEYFAVEAPKGKLYQVELAPSEEEYLDWDKPLSEQSDLVKSSLVDAIKSGKFDGGDWTLEMYREQAVDALTGKETNSIRGSDFYRFAQAVIGGKSVHSVVKSENQKEASDLLHSIGIRGIRYLDGTSRSAGEGNSNYVIFSDEDVSITAKFAKDAKHTNETPESIRSALVERFGSQGIAALEKSGMLKIMSVNDAPASILETAIEQNASALYTVDGTAYLFSDRMMAQDAPGKLLHELGEHHGLETMLGDSGFKALTKRLANMAKAKGSVAYGAWQGVKSKYGEFDGMTDAELASNDRFVHEVLAAIGENKEGQKTSIWRELLAKVKSWLASKGLASDWLNEGDIVNLVNGSLKKIMREAEYGLVAPQTMAAIITDHFKQIVESMKADKQLIEECA